MEYAHTIAPGASILLVETPVSETEGVTGFPQIVKAEEYVINHHLGDVISQSFSATEQTFSSKASVDALRGAYIDAYAARTSPCSPPRATAVPPTSAWTARRYYTFPTTTWPPSDPLVTGVGGTQLHLDANGTPHLAGHGVERHLQRGRPTSSSSATTGRTRWLRGGGKSVLFSRPSYQDLVRGVVGRSRGVPDISMSAACNGAVDVYQSFPGVPAGWYPTCGTSEATPLFAGIVALADQVAGHSLGLINPALYAMSARAPAGLVDVTSGNNTVSFTQGGTRRTRCRASAPARATTWPPGSAR